MEIENRKVASIGVFDSGISGLTVTREIMRRYVERERKKGRSVE